MSHRGIPLAWLSPEQRDVALGRVAPEPAPATNPPTPVMFFAAGLPATKGSTRAFVDARTGKPRVKGDCKRTKGWQCVVAVAATAAGVRVLPGGVTLELTFFLPRPRSHYGTGRRATKVKPSAPSWPAQKPDGDKLERAVLDALTGVAYVDDSGVRGVRWEKAWAPPPERGLGEPGVFVRVVPVLEDA